MFAKSSLKKRYRRDIGTDEAVKIAVESLYDAADDDSATGGPDPTRDLYPVVMTATAEGSKRIDEAVVADVARTVIAARTENPYG
jgi:proteasome beta subunit